MEKFDWIVGEGVFSQLVWISELVPAVETVIYADPVLEGTHIRVVDDCQSVGVHHEIMV